MRNFFIAGGGVNDEGKSFPEWRNFRAKLELELGITNYAQFKNYLDAGHIAKWLADWIIKYRNYNETPWLGSELRKLFLYYFERKHPEENLQGLKSDYPED
jgi:hypothetical protein